jgi:hypothetical protein
VTNLKKWKLRMSIERMKKDNEWNVKSVVITPAR